MSEIHAKHSLFEKTLFRSLIYGAYFIGTYAIFKENIWFAALYVIFMILSLYWVGKRFCSHCPYPCKHSDCMMVPYNVYSKFVKPDLTPMTKLDRMSFPIVMLFALPLIPQYWLFKDYHLLILFWAVFIITWPALLYIRCSNCLYKDCPLNITK